MNSKILIPLAPFLVGPAAALAEVRYTIDELPPPPGASASRATGINDRGQVVGFATYDDTRGTRTRPIIWENAAPRDMLGERAAAGGRALAISNGGVVVGETVMVEGSVGFPFVAPTPGVKLHLLRSSGRATAVNDSGYVSGYIGVDGTSTAAIWDDDYTRRIKVPGATSSAAAGINNAGQVVGGATFSAGSPSRGFLYDSGVVTDLSTWAGGEGTASDINNHGEIVGGAHVPSGEFRPFYWHDGSGRALDLLPGHFFGSATSINDAGDVVGFSYGDDSLAAMIWTDGEWLDLGDLIPAAGGWELRAALSINAGGSIVGWGLKDGDARAFLLTPVPEPALLTAVTLGMILPLRRRRGG